MSLLRTKYLQREHADFPGLNKVNVERMPKPKVIQQQTITTGSPAANDGKISGKAKGEGIGESTLNFVHAIGAHVFHPIEGHGKVVEHGQGDPVKGYKELYVVQHEAPKPFTRVYRHGELQKSLVGEAMDEGRGWAADMAAENKARKAAERAADKAHDTAEKAHRVERHRAHAALNKERAQLHKNVMKAEHRGNQPEWEDHLANLFGHMKKHGKLPADKGTFHGDTSESVNEARHFGHFSDTFNTHHNVGVWKKEAADRGFEVHTHSVHPSGRPGPYYTAKDKEGNHRGEFHTDPLGESVNEDHESHYHKVVKWFQENRPKNCPKCGGDASYRESGVTAAGTHHILKCANCGKVHATIGDKQLGESLDKALGEAYNAPNVGNSNYAQTLPAETGRVKKKLDKRLVVSNREANADYNRDAGYVAHESVNENYTPEQLKIRRDRRVLINDYRRNAGKVRHHEIAIQGNYGTQQDLIKHHQAHTSAKTHLEWNIRHLADHVAKHGKLAGIDESLDEAKAPAKKVSPWGQSHATKPPTGPAPKTKKAVQRYWYPSRNDPRYESVEINEDHVHKPPQGLLDVIHHRGMTHDTEVQDKQNPHQASFKVHDSSKVVHKALHHALIAHGYYPDQETIRLRDGQHRNYNHANGDWAQVGHTKRGHTDISFIKGYKAMAEDYAASAESVSKLAPHDLHSMFKYAAASRGGTPKEHAEQLAQQHGKPAHHYWDQVKHIKESLDEATVYHDYDTWKKHAEKWGAARFDGPTGGLTYAIHPHGHTMGLWNHHGGTGHIHFKESLDEGYFKDLATKAEDERLIRAHLRKVKAAGAKELHKNIDALGDPEYWKTVGQKKAERGIKEEVITSLDDLQPIFEEFMDEHLSASEHFAYKKGYVHGHAGNQWPHKIAIHRFKENAHHYQRGVDAGMADRQKMMDLNKGHSLKVGVAESKAPSAKRIAGFLLRAMAAPKRSEGYRNRDDETFAVSKREALKAHPKGSRIVNDKMGWHVEHPKVVKEDLKVGDDGQEQKKVRGSNTDSKGRTTGTVRRKYLGNSRGTTATGKPAHVIDVQPVIGNGDRNVNKTTPSGERKRG